MEVKPHVEFDGECGMSLETIQGNRAAFRVDLG